MKNENDIQIFVLKVLIKSCMLNKANYSLILTKTRKSEIIATRHMAYHILYKTLDLSYNEISSYVMGQNHATLLNAISSVNNQINTNNRYCDRYIQLENFTKKLYEIMFSNTNIVSENERITNEINEILIPLIDSSVLLKVNSLLKELSM